MASLFADIAAERSFTHKGEIRCNIFGWIFENSKLVRWPAGFPKWGNESIYLHYSALCLTGQRVATSQSVATSTIGLRIFLSRSLACGGGGRASFCLLLLSQV